MTSKWAQDFAAKKAKQEAFKQSIIAEFQKPLSPMHLLMLPVYWESSMPNLSCEIFNRYTQLDYRELGMVMRVESIVDSRGVTTFDICFIDKGSERNYSFYRDCDKHEYPGPILNGPIFVEKINIDNSGIITFSMDEYKLREYGLLVQADVVSQHFKITYDAVNEKFLDPDKYIVDTTEFWFDLQEVEGSRYMGYGADSYPENDIIAAIQNHPAIAPNEKSMLRLAFLDIPRNDMSSGILTVIQKIKNSKKGHSR